ncbi:glycerophosphodiester phosphodiesterase [Litorilinea aerophila]|uniref:Glycerophosphodiester phosphodiesterase n=1 Tax=Litorilinea aerophila TaxID=1204385 RepID=A0A540VII0_9CHLR|nr:glycerophosphodiester phosphodiesterase [Litorilinea aerophila]MCC9075802.1 glycerophosphodiester phosphodiesterase [Litorilinea aerophila]GIV77272.1 MAG: hypothetical protein KatS3mg050_1666 [Litorilinea sp.]
MNWQNFHQVRQALGRPLIIAHRGVPHRDPENSLRGFARALAEGADVLETDLRVTRDGAIVLIHDATLERTTDGRGQVSMHTLAELKRLRLRERDGRPGDQTIPTLLELLAMTQAQTPLLLELKAPLFLARTFARKLVEILAAYRALDRVALVSFRPELVRSVKAVCPSIPAGHITLTDWRPRGGAELYGPYWPLLYVNPWYVAQAHRRGALVAPLDPAPLPRLGHYLRLGVDALLADDPAAVRQALGRCLSA